MASRTPRIFLRPLKNRFYGTAAAAKSESSAPFVKQGPKVTKLENGVTVASIENYAPVSHVAVIFNAGSRFESVESLGVTHALRVASTLSTMDSSGLNLVRSVQQVGGDISCTATREYMIYGTTGLRDQISIGIEAIRQITTAPAFKGHEWGIFLSKLAMDIANLQSLDPNVVLLENLHEAAYRNTLGRFLYAERHLLGTFSPDLLMEHMENYYTQGRMAIVGVGIDHDQLVSQAGSFLPFPASDVKTEKATYYGGESRIHTGGEMTQVAVVTEGPSLGSKDLLPAGILQMIMGTGPYVKYSESTVTSKLGHAVSEVVSSPCSVSCINANYTDSGLFGFSVLAHGDDVEKGLRAAYETFGKITKSGATDADVARGKNQLKAAIAMNHENTSNMLLDVIEQVMGSGQIASYDTVSGMIDAVKPTDVTAVAKKLINGKRSMASLGNLKNVPYLDQLA